MTRIPNPFLVGLALLVGACGPSDPAEDAGHAADTTIAATAEAAGHAHAAEGEGEALLPIMQKLGSYMAQLTHGLMTDDSAMVARGADSIAHHAPISREELERIHGLLGDRMAEFERLDETVHEASVRLHEAATAGDPATVLSRLTEVQRGCIACHTQFRATLRTNAPR